MLTFQQFVAAVLQLLTGKYTSIQRASNDLAVEIDLNGRTGRIEQDNPAGFWLKLAGGPAKSPAQFQPTEGMVRAVAEEIQLYFELPREPVSREQSDRWLKWTNDVFAGLDAEYGANGGGGAQRRYGRFTVIYDPARDGTATWIAILPWADRSAFPDIVVAWRLTKPDDVSRKLITEMRRVEGSSEYKAMSHEADD